MTAAARAQWQLDHYRARLEVLEDVPPEERNLDLIAHYRRQVAKLERALH